MPPASPHRLEHDGGEVGLLLPVAVRAERAAQALEARSEPALGLPALQPPRGESQVHAGLRWQISERERGERLLLRPDPLRQRRFRQARRPQGAGEHHAGLRAFTPPSPPGPLLPGHEARQHLLDQQPAHLRRYTREHDHEPVRRWVL